MKPPQAVRGMHDALPGDAPQWQLAEQTIRSVLQSYGYREIRLPLLEKTELFSRSIGRSTDIVAKEMYTFSDRNGESLTLRPEGTAGCARALLQHGLLHAGPQRTWYLGPMFRHERPQKGRLRQFHQAGAEAVGIVDADIDAEIILLSARIWRALGITDLRLELNSLGSAAARAAYQKQLVEYLSDHRERLDQDSLKRLETNPLRILDSKNPEMQPLLQGAPSLLEVIDGEAAEHFALLRRLLDANGLEYVINPRLVRGLDYYNRTVFEWTTERLGAQGALCAGGRYDGLFAQLGGKDAPAVGWAMGLERILALKEFSVAETGADLPHAYLVQVGAAAVENGLRLAECLRDRLPGLRLLAHCGGGNFKSQLKKADRSRADYALILGEDEAAKNTVQIKPLRDEREQYEVSQELLAAELRRLL